MQVEDVATTRVLVVDDHETFAELLSGALDREHDLTSVGHATTARDAVDMAHRLRPDLVMMDVQLPDADGFVATERIMAELPWTRVVVLTAHTDPGFVLRAADAGACGFLPKDGSLAHMLATLRAATLGGFVCDPALVAATQAVARTTGSSRSSAPRPAAPALTQRETEVLGLLGQGRVVREIAADLGITEETCRGYVKSILAKLGARTQLQAVVTAWRIGLLSDGDG